MTYEDDYGKPVYFVDEAELRCFIESTQQHTEGYAYEWEGEGITHIRFSPALHGFGKMHKLKIVKCDITDVPADQLCVLPDGRATIGGVEAQLIPSLQNLYSRSKGLIEVDALVKKRVLIVGLGSGGSAIAVQLARTGIGHFVLADFDRVELHNLSRHVCTVNDLGRLKTDAIKGKNPHAIVDKLPIDVNKNFDILDEEIAKADIVMCCTDNNSSRFNISDLLVKHQKVGIFGRCTTRAEGGDIFIYRPGGACYVCLVGNSWFDSMAEEITDLNSAKRAGRIPAYVSEADAEAVVQVGLGTDIEPMNIMASKLALTELSRGTNAGIASLEKEFTYNYYFWANRRDNLYANWGSFDNTDRLPTIMKWYGVHVPRNEECSLCGHSQLHLDEQARQAMKMLDEMGGLNLDNLSL